MNFKIFSGLYLRNCNIQKLIFDRDIGWGLKMANIFVLFHLFHISLCTMLFPQAKGYGLFLYPPEAPGGYFRLAFATPPPPHVEIFSALTL